MEGLSILPGRPFRRGGVVRRASKVIGVAAQNQKGVGQLGHRAQLMLRAEGELRENNHPLCRCCVHQHNNTTKSSLCLSRLSCPHSFRRGSARGCWSTSNSSSESDTRQRLHPPPPIRRLRPPRPTIRRLRPPPPRARSEIPPACRPPQRRCCAGGSAAGGHAGLDHRRFSQVASKAGIWLYTDGFGSSIPQLLKACTRGERSPLSLAPRPTHTPTGYADFAIFARRVGSVFRNCQWYRICDAGASRAAGQSP